MSNETSNPVLRLTTFDDEVQDAQDWLLENVQMEFPDAVLQTQEDQDAFLRKVYEATSAYKTFLRVCQDLTEEHNDLRARASEAGTFQIVQDPLNSDTVMLRVGIIAESVDLDSETNGDEG